MHKKKEKTKTRINLVFDYNLKKRKTHSRRLIEKKKKNRQRTLCGMMPGKQEVENESVEDHASQSDTRIMEWNKMSQRDRRMQTQNLTNGRLDRDT